MVHVACCRASSFLNRVKVQEGLGERFAGTEIVAVDEMKQLVAVMIAVPAMKSVLRHGCRHLVRASMRCCEQSYQTNSEHLNFQNTATTIDRGGRSHCLCVEVASLVERWQLV